MKAVRVLSVVASVSAATGPQFSQGKVTFHGNCSPPCREDILRSPLDVMKCITGAAGSSCASAIVDLEYNLPAGTDCGSTSPSIDEKVSLDTVLTDLETMGLPNTLLLTELDLEYPKHAATCAEVDLNSLKRSTDCAGLQIPLKVTTINDKPTKTLKFVPASGKLLPIDVSTNDLLIASKECVQERFKDSTLKLQATHYFQPYETDGVLTFRASHCNSNQCNTVRDLTQLQACLLAAKSDKGCQVYSEYTRTYRNVETDTCDRTSPTQFHISLSPLLADEKTVTAAGKKSVTLKNVHFSKKPLELTRCGDMSLILATDCTDVGDITSLTQPDKNVLEFSGQQSVDTSVASLELFADFPSASSGCILNDDTDGDAFTVESVYRSGSLARYSLPAFLLATSYLVG